MCHGLLNPFISEILIFPSQIMLNFTKILMRNPCNKILRTGPTHEICGKFTTKQGEFKSQGIHVKFNKINNKIQSNGRNFRTLF